MFYNAVPYNAMIAVENKAIQWNAMHAGGLEWMGGSWNHLMGRRGGN